MKHGGDCFDIASMFVSSHRRVSGLPVRMDSSQTVAVFGSGLMRFRLLVGGAGDDEVDDSADDDSDEVAVVAAIPCSTLTLEAVAPTETAHVGKEGDGEIKRGRSEVSNCVMRLFATATTAAAIGESDDEEEEVGAAGEGSGMGCDDLLVNWLVFTVIDMLK